MQEHILLNTHSRQSGLASKPFFLLSGLLINVLGIIQLNFLQHELFLSMTEQNKTNAWWVYLLRCNDNSLYAGVTTDINRRIDEHNNSKLGAKYTRARRPVILAYLEQVENKSLACKREYKIRHLTKLKKEQLVSDFSST